MAPQLFRELKGVNFSCASPASAAVCTSIDRRSIVCPSTGRDIDSHRNHLRESRRADALNHLSQLPSKPKAYTQKSRKSPEKPPDLISPAGSSRYLLNDTAFSDVFPDLEPAPALPPIESPRHQPIKRYESSVLRPSTSTSPRLQPLTREESVVPRSSTCASPRLQPTKIYESAALRPSTSTSPRLQPIKRDESAVLRPSTSTSLRLQPLTREESVVPRPTTCASPRLQPLTKDKSAALRPPSSTQPQDEVVLLKVSLHCKGCEGKVRKHISKMEGVTSFNINMATKKVTVIGNVTPLGVLNSVSKVKNAHFWSSPPRCRLPSN